MVMQSSAPTPGAPSPWDSVMGAIEDSISQCTFLEVTYTAENPHANGSTLPGSRPHLRPPRQRDPHDTFPAPTTTADAGKTDVLLSANGPSTVAVQQRSARSQFWQPMPRPRLQRTANVRPEKIQLPIAEQNFGK